MDPNHKPLGQPKTGRHWIRHGLSFLFIALAFLALIAYQVYNAHAVATANARVNVKNLTMTLESKLEQALQEAQWEVIKVAADIDMEAMQAANANRYRPQINRWLKSLASPAPDSLAVRVFDANGDSLYSSNDNEPAFNIADRNYFRQLQADPSIHVLFSDVFIGRVTRQPAIFAANAVRDRNGAFLGIALNGVELSSLHKYFSAIEIGTEGIVAVRRLDNGAYVLRYPGAVEITNEPAMDLPIRAALLKDGRPGSVELVSPVDGVRRIYGYRMIGGLPFFVVVGTSGNDYLAGWRQTAFMSLLTSLLFLASLAAVFLRLARTEARRVQTLALLQTSEQSYRSLVDNVSFGVVVHGPDTSILLSNARAASLLGLTQAQMLGRTALDPDWCFLQDDGAPMPLKDYPVNRVIASGERLQNDVVGVRHPDRSGCTWLLCNAYPMPDPEGKIQQVVVTFADITERREAEQSLLEHDRRLSAVIANFPGGISMFDANLRLVAHNEAFRKLLDFPDSLIKKRDLNFADFIRYNAQRGEYGPGDIEQQVASRVEIARHFQPHRFERARPNGTILEIRGEPMIEGGFVTVYVDITQRNQAQEALREREAQLQGILESTSDGILAIDHEGKVIRFNQRFGQLWQLPQALLDSKDDETLLHYVVNQLREPEAFVKQVQALYRSDLEATDTINFKDGRVFERFTSPLRSDSSVIGRIWSFRDITERRTAERELNESQARYRTLVEWAPEPIVVHGGGKMLYVNPAAIKMFSAKSAKDLVGKPILDLVHPDFHQVVLARVGAQGPEDVALPMIEEKFLKLDGTPIDVEVQSMFIIFDGAAAMHVAMRDVTAHKADQEKIQLLAFSDPLTGLPNRRLLMDRLEQAMASAARHGHQDALLFIDLDNFKTINDTLGHDKGDLLLKQISQRLRSSVREGDTVARLSGDEFVVLLKGLSENAPDAAAQAQVVGQKILDTLAQPYELDGHGHHSSASVGISLFGGSQRETVEEPLKRAELAMYQAKTAGRNTVRSFEPEMYTAVLSRASMEADLRQALAQDQFLLHYQPQGSDSGRLSGVEALVRWQHPQRGLVSPAEFIPVAEASGLILPLGQWVLKSACKQLAAWASRPQRSHLTMAVNVSAREFRKPDFVEEVLSILHTTGVKPERLKIELTESVLVDNVEDIIAKMGALKARGVGFALDDFGTGYSSLSYLKRLPLDQLKIDRSFVGNILTDRDDAAIAKMVVALAESMELEVIAEGVETEAQRDFLGKLGCRNYQGYLFSRPLPIEEFEVFASQASQGLNS